MGVSTYPGATAQTRTFGANSSAIDLVTVTSPALRAACSISAPEKPSLAAASAASSAINSRGEIFIDEFGANRLARIDRTGMKLQEYVLPHPDSRPRRIPIGSR